MKTYAEAKDFVEHRGFVSARRDALASLELAAIDEPLRALVESFATLPHAFSLQCCFGHFLWRDDQDPHSLEAIPDDATGKIDYRIAYFACCLENSARGHWLRDRLAEFVSVAPGLIQFGSPSWFWERCVNTYALQVQPESRKDRDRLFLGDEEARQIERARTQLFGALRNLSASEASRQGEP